MKRKITPIALVLGGLVAGLALGPGQAATAQVGPTTQPVRPVQPVKVVVKVVKVKPPVGYILTSRGRLVKINDREGCHVIRYDEITRKRVGDPGDGEFYCAR